ncbi:hypothetical protein GF337_20890, partial [candidate division KSB1 bacterium]|nr:hypothetical protein [candidate division KSB1 bacterium]
SVREKFTVSLVVENDAWTKVSSVAALEQSRSNPNLLFMSRRERGALYSEDAGESWRFSMALAQYNVSMFRIHPENTSIIYAITDSGLLKSNDGGSSWQKLQSGLPDDIRIVGFDFDPSNSSKIWIGSNYGIHYSTDGGQSWIAGGSLPSWRDDKDIVKIAVDPSNSSVIYAATLGRFLYKSGDGGSTWEMKRGETSTRLGASSIYDIVVDPTNTSILYAATINRGIYKSMDAGENWRPVSEGMEDLETRNIVMNPMDNSELFVTTNTELYVSEDSAATWNSLPSPSAGSSIVDLLIDPLNTENLALAVPGNIYMSNDGGMSWQEKNSIDRQSILFEGTFTFETWSDTLTFVDAEGEPVDITPHRYNDILAAYDAGLRDEPPEDVDPNPSATKMIFTPDKPFPEYWMYRVLVQGAFDSGTLKENYGARDLHGMSIEFDYISYFIKS